MLCLWQVDTILRFLGAPDLPSEVDVEVVLQDQLTGQASALQY